MSASRFESPLSASSTVLCSSPTRGPNTPKEQQAGTLPCSAQPTFSRPVEESSRKVAIRSLLDTGSKLEDVGSSSSSAFHPPGSSAADVAKILAVPSQASWSVCSSIPLEVQALLQSQQMSQQAVAQQQQGAQAPQQAASENPFEGSSPKIPGSDGLVQQQQQQLLQSVVPRPMDGSNASGHAGSNCAWITGANPGSMYGVPGIVPVVSVLQQQSSDPHPTQMQSLLHQNNVQYLQHHQQQQQQQQTNQQQLMFHQHQQQMLQQQHQQQLIQQQIMQYQQMQMQMALQQQRQQQLQQQVYAHNSSAPFTFANLLGAGGSQIAFHPHINTSGKLLPPASLLTSTAKRPRIGQGSPLGADEDSSAETEGAIHQNRRLQRRSPSDLADRKSDYWKNFDTVACEIQQFMQRMGPSTEPGRMPSIRQLESGGVSRGLIEAIRRYHGGFTSTAARLGLRTASNSDDEDYDEEDGSERRCGSNKLSLQIIRRPRGFWKKFSNLEIELRAVMKQLGCRNCMPTMTELKRHGHIALIHGFYLHGGAKVVAARLGLPRQSDIAASRLGLNHQLDLPAPRNPKRRRYRDDDDDDEDEDEEEEEIEGDDADEDEKDADYGKRRKSSRNESGGNIDSAGSTSIQKLIEASQR